MPEGHTLRIAARRLAPLVGAQVRVQTPHPRHRYAGIDSLDGHRLDDVRAVGKHLLLRFDDGRTLHSHLRMRGSWQVVPEGAPWRRAPSAAWLVLRANGLVAVLFDGPVLELLDDARLRAHPVLSRLGPDILADAYDPAALVARIRRGVEPATAVAELLLDQRVACGIGNLYKSEALFACGIDPFAPISALDDDALAAVYGTARRMMLAAVETGHEQPHRIYGRRACPRCGARVRTRRQGDDGRTTWWCPACQPAPAHAPAG